MISYEVGKRYDAAIRGEGTQFDLADDGAFLAVYFSRPDEKKVAQFFAEAMDLKMKPFSKTEYFSSLNDIYTKYSTKDLLKLSSPGFKMH